MSTTNINTKSIIASLTIILLTISIVATAVTAQPNIEDNTSSVKDVEPNDEITNATPLKYGENISATLSSGDDVDYYAVNATAGHVLLPRLYLHTRFKGSAISIDIIAPNGQVSTEMTNDQGFVSRPTAGEAQFIGDATKMAYTADVMESDGTYYLRVRESALNRTEGNATYNYNLTAAKADLDQFDPNENATMATSLELGATVNATMSGYDHDVYAMNLTAGENYTIHVNSPDQHPSKHVYVFDNASPLTGNTYYNADDTALNMSQFPFYHNETVSFTAEENGTHYILITEFNINPVLLEQANYSLTVRESENSSNDSTEQHLGNSDSIDSEPNDDMMNATPIEFGEEINATLSSPNDTDYYAVNGTAGDGLIPRLNLTNTLTGSAIRVEIVGPTGKVSTENPRGPILGSPSLGGSMAIESNTAYTADVMESNSTYYIRVMEDEKAETNISATYPYNITATIADLDEYDPNENGSTASPIELSTTVNSTIVGYDTDVYAVNVTAGRNYTVYLLSSVQESSYPFPLRLSVFENASVASEEEKFRDALSSKGQISRNTTVTFTAQQNSTYYIRILKGITTVQRIDELSNYTLIITDDEDGINKEE